jgi:hypothetical protein
MTHKYEQELFPGDLIICKFSKQLFFVVAARAYRKYEAKLGNVWGIYTLLFISKNEISTHDSHYAVRRVWGFEKI